VISEKTSVNFVNRLKELDILSQAYDKNAALIVIYGRRRIGKTRLIRHWGREQSFIYTQAVEGAEILQIDQIYQDLRHLVPHPIVPRTWPELLGFLSLIPGKTMLVIDEFPYLVAGNPSVPSLLQKWLEQNRPDHLTLVLMGSSQRMMHDTFLSHEAPLYQRASRILKLRPLSFRHFLQAVLPKNTDLRLAFRLFSMTGGVPKYWSHLNPAKTEAIAVAEEFYFEDDGIFRDEPYQLLKDEFITGTMPLSILQAIGQGDSKPSDIARRLSLKQTSLSWSLKLLTDSFLVRREVPFGEAEANAKKTLYSIDDPALAFWFHVFSPHRSRWFTYAEAKKQKLIDEHCASMLERLYREKHPGAMRYWEGSDIEIDCIRPVDGPAGIIVEELKWRPLSREEMLRTLGELKSRFGRSKLADKYPQAELRVVDGDEALQVICGD
jgi:AAA+ ATPase superfamily predicted ATPase